jgi:hypothetical protein
MLQQASLPADPFGAYSPSEEMPWDRRRVNHLYRRLCFGAKPEWIKPALDDGPGAAIERIFAFDPASDPFADLFEQTRGLTPFTHWDPPRDWWFNRMLRTPQPLQERIALCWHDHFATAGSKIWPPIRLHNQIDLFRKQGLGSFRDLLLAVGRDAAMLLWLDGVHSSKGAPNENYAREVMELFVLGEGHYSEADIKELARCFTGWRHHEQTESRRDDNAFDNGEKTILGRTGAFDDAQACDLLLEQPAASRWIARKLLIEFVHPKPDDVVIDHYAARLRDTNWHVGTVLREMVSSRMFFSDWAYRSKIKSPVELLVGSVFMLDCGANSSYLREQSTKMGQNLLFPPTVAGWEGEEAWINSTTIVYRYNFGLDLVKQQEHQFYARLDIPKFVAENELRTAELVIDHFAERLLDGPLPEARRAKLYDYINRNDKNEVATFKGEWHQVHAKVRGAVHLMMAMPEFQLA